MGTANSENISQTNIAKPNTEFTILYGYLTRAPNELFLNNMLNDIVGNISIGIWQLFYYPNWPTNTKMDKVVCTLDKKIHKDKQRPMLMPANNPQIRVYDVNKEDWHIVVVPSIISIRKYKGEK